MPPGGRDARVRVALLIDERELEPPVAVPTQPCRAGHSCSSIRTPTARGLRVFAGVRLVRHARADVVAFERAVIRLPEVVHTHHVTGNYDYLLQVEVADLAAYEDFHANRLACLPGVAMVTSYVTMKTLSADTARPAGRRGL